MKKTLFIWYKREKQILFVIPNKEIESPFLSMLEFHHFPLPFL